MTPLETPLFERDRFYPHNLPQAWAQAVDAFFARPEGERLLAFLEQSQRAGETIYPPDPYRALRTLAAEDVRVLILGQDPYHGPGQAMGMAFSVPASLKKLPPSLKNIFGELAREYDARLRVAGDLSDWARQGVLLLNSVLTVREASAASHAKMGWETLTDQFVRCVLEASCRNASPLVLMLWGASAQAKMAAVDHFAGNRLAGDKNILVLTSNHPSPLSARRGPTPFIGCGHFRQANAFLEAHGARPIDWLGDLSSPAASADEPEGLRQTSLPHGGKSASRPTGNSRQGEFF